MNNAEVRKVIEDRLDYGGDRSDNGYYTTDTELMEALKVALTALGENEELKQENQSLLEHHEAQTKDFQAELESWRFELAYYTKEDVATPKGVREFVKGLMNKHTNQ